MLVAALVPGTEAGCGAGRPSEILEAGLGAGAAARSARIDGTARMSVITDEVAVGLEAGRQRPIHLLVGEDVDVGVDHEHSASHWRARRSRRRWRCAPRRHALTDRDSQRVHAAARRVHRRRPARAGAPQRRQTIALVRTPLSCAVSVRVQRLAGADSRGLEQGSRRRVIAVRWNTGLRLTAAVVAEVFAVRPFRLHYWRASSISPPAPIRRRPAPARRWSRISRPAAAPRAAHDQREVVARQWRRRGEVIDRWRPTMNATGTGLAGGGARLIDRAQVARRLRSTPASVRPRSIRRRMPHW